MDTWSDLCRCCLSANSEVSLLDSEQNVTEKFLEVTTIEVRRISVVTCLFRDKRDESLIFIAAMS